MNMNKLVLGTIIFVTLLIEPYNNVYASSSINSTYELGSGTTVYQYDELLKKYQSSGTTYNRNMISYKIKQYDGELAAESYQAVNAQYTKSMEELAQLNNTKDQYLEYRATLTDPDALANIDAQIDAVNAQIQQYNSNVNTLKSNMLDAKLQEEVNKFYSGNEYIIKQEAKAKLENEFLKQCYSLILYSEKKDYYEAYQEYLKIAKRVEGIKYELGLSDEQAFKAAETNLLKNIINIVNYQSAFDSAYNQIKEDIGQKDNFKIALPLKVGKKDYNLERMQNAFENNNVSLKQLQYMAMCYGNYLYSNNGSNALREQISWQISDYNLQYQELKLNIKTFVSNAISAYGQAFDNLEMAEKDLQLATKNYEAVVAKRANKRATDLDVSKAKYEVEAAQVAYYESIYNVKVWQDILDHTIYGASP